MFVFLFAVADVDSDPQLPGWPCPPSADSISCYKRIVVLQELDNPDGSAEPCPSGIHNRDSCIQEFLRMQWLTLASELLEGLSSRPSFSNQLNTRGETRNVNEPPMDTSVHVLPPRTALKDLCPSGMGDLECLSLLTSASDPRLKSPPDNLNNIRLSELLTGLPLKGALRTRGTSKRDSLCPQGVAQIDCFHHYLTLYSTASSHSHNKFVGR